MTRKSQLLNGAKDILPILLGVAPFGMIYGVLAVRAGLTVESAQAMSSIVFAGSSQFMVVQLMAVQTPWIVVVLTAFVINLRHALYSASVAPHLKHLSPLWKGLLSYVLVDEAYAVGITHYEREGSAGYQHWYLLGSGLALWTCWQACTALGIFLGAQIPDDDLETRIAEWVETAGTSLAAGPGLDWDEVYARLDNDPQYEERKGEYENARSASAREEAFGRVLEMVRKQARAVAARAVKVDGVIVCPVQFADNCHASWYLPDRVKSVTKL